MNKINTGTVDDFKNANRLLNKSVEFISDTFKLSSATMLKNIGVDGRSKMIVPIEHCHIFHTYDSMGKKMIHCGHVGGHSHEITITTDKNGNFVTKCSGPIQNNGSEKILAEDKHIHQVEYIKSETLKPIKLHADAQRYISQYMREPTISDVKEELR